MPEHYASDAQRIATSAGDSTTTGTGEPPASRAGVAAIAPLPDADADFWQRFDDPVLNELVDAALRENHDLRIALRVSTNALLREARFDQLPTVTANAAPATRGRAPISCPAFRGPIATRTATVQPSSQRGARPTAAFAAASNRNAPTLRRARRTSPQHNFAIVGEVARSYVGCAASRAIALPQQCGQPARDASHVEARLRRPRHGSTRRVPARSSDDVVANPSIRGRRRRDDAPVGY